jgi:hypothetical protein
VVGGGGGEEVNREGKVVEGGGEGEVIGERGGEGEVTEEKEGKGKVWRRKRRKDRGKGGEDRGEKENGRRRKRGLVRSCQFYRFFRFAGPAKRNAI